MSELNPQLRDKARSMFALDDGLKDGSSNVALAGSIAIAE